MSAEKKASGVLGLAVISAPTRRCQQSAGILKQGKNFRPSPAAISLSLLLIPGVGRKGKRGAEPSPFCAPLLIIVSGVPQRPSIPWENAKAPVEIFSPGAFFCPRVSNAPRPAEWAKTTGRG